MNSRHLRQAFSVALVVLMALKTIKAKQVNDEELLDLKINLVRSLLDRNREKSVMRALMTFIKIYVNFSKPETSHIFEKTIQAITNNTTSMGIEELVISIKKA